jgi:hypothetical protein
MPSRFVILQHRVGGGEHWDLMVERGDALVSWRLQREPVTPCDLPLEADRISDHRIAYLDYEGPISDDRGHVIRVDSGTIEWLEFSKDVYSFRLFGNRLCGTFKIIAHGVGWKLEKA